MKHMRKRVERLRGMHDILPEEYQRRGGVIERLMTYLARATQGSYSGGHFSAGAGEVKATEGTRKGPNPAPSHPCLYIHPNSSSLCKP